MQILDSTFAGNAMRDWLIAAAVAVGVTGGLNLLKFLLVRRGQKLARRTSNELDDVIVATFASTKFVFLLFLGVWAGARAVVLPQPVSFSIRLITILATVLQVSAWANVAVRALVQRRIQQTVEQDPAAATTVAAIGFLVRIVLWFILILVALSNLGIEIGPLLAGLGVGGVAVALALQNILGDLFASLSIVLDKPFVIGDAVIVGESTGTVEYIGLKTTRLRATSGEQIIISNSDLLRSRVRNMKRMHERRVQFDLPIAHRTHGATLARVPALVQQCIEAQPSLRFERAHLRDFANVACNFEVVYWVRTADYDTFVKAQHAMNLEMHRRLAEERIELARPVQRVVLERSALESASEMSGEEEAGPATAGMRD
jgi:small-conductance mechanosensitive channel